MLQILIADDHAVVRRGLRQIITETSDMVIAGEATNGREVLSKVRATGYDVVILDITMPGIDGMDTLAQLKSEKPGLPVLMMSMHPEEQYAVRALKAGASGYLTKESSPEELVAAIRKVTSGGKYVSSSLAERLASVLHESTHSLPHEILSDREYQVMCLIATGKTVTEIATKLSLSVKTISTYRSRILDKMKLKNNVELANYATQNHCIE